MAVFANPNIVEDGLVLYLDAGNERSYTSGSSTMIDLSDNGVSATLNNFTHIESPYIGVRLNDDTGRINLSTIQNITTVELWFYQHINTGQRYLLDMRTGGAGGWIYHGSVGSNWSSGQMYINGEYISAPNLPTMETYSYQNYVQVVVIANTPATDDMNLFSRYSNNETLDVTFYNGKVYNRALTPEEIKQNYNALRGRFGR